MGQHIFVNVLKALSDRIVLIVGPISGEDLVGPPAEQQVVVGLDQELVELRVPAVVPEGEDPSAKPKVARRILFGSARRLHDAVERYHDGAGQLTHWQEPRPTPPQSPRCQSCASSSWPRTRASRPPCRHWSLPGARREA